MNAPSPSVKLGARFQGAFLFAAQKHGLQTRKKTGIPYISHLMSVAAIVLEAGGDEEEAIAALLHDVVEDCGGRPMLREVADRFGSDVARMVEGCTDSFEDPKPSWRQRKEEYLRRLPKEHSRHAGGFPRLTKSTMLVLFSGTTGFTERPFGRDSTAVARGRSGTIGRWRTNSTVARPTCSTAN